MNAIVVADRSWAIGRDGGLLFSLPTDMKRFRSLTMGGAVILGRKTLESFPGGRPLPGRKNIVITRQKDLLVEGAAVVSSLAEALDAAGDIDRLEAFQHAEQVGVGNELRALLGG